MAIAFALPVLRARPWRARTLTAAFVPAALLVAGGVLPYLACLAWFGARGALAALVDVLFVFTPRYTALSWVGVDRLWLGYEGFNEWLLNYSSLGTIGVILALTLHPDKRQRFAVGVVFGIIAVHVAGVVMQAKFFPYHFGATWPLTSLVAGLGFFGSGTRLDRAVRFEWRSFCRCCRLDLSSNGNQGSPRRLLVRTEKRIALFTSAVRDEHAVDCLASVADVDAAANREVATFLQGRVAADRSVFVWGFEPVIYDLCTGPQPRGISTRSPAGRVGT